MVVVELGQGDQAGDTKAPVADHRKLTPVFSKTQKKAKTKTNSTRRSNSAKRVHSAQKSSSAPRIHSAQKSHSAQRSQFVQSERSAQRSNSLPNSSMTSMMSNKSYGSGRTSKMASLELLSERVKVTLI